MLIFYGAPARLPAYDTTPSACDSYNRVNLNWEPPLRLQTDFPTVAPGLVDLCCQLNSTEDPCTGEGGLYMEGEKQVPLYRLLQSFAEQNACAHHKLRHCRT